MKCPFCGFENDKVVDSRESKEGESIRRRRECLKCEKRFTTYERIDEIPYMVVKKDGRREKFERQKILSGVLRAVAKLRNFCRGGVDRRPSLGELDGARVAA